MGWREWLSWRGLLLAGLALAVTAASAAAWAAVTAPSPAATAFAQAQRAGGRPDQSGLLGGGSSRKTIMVYVSGEVLHPGMYRLTSGLRVLDALAAAGGILPDADPSRLPNLAGRLTDGKEVKVPRLSTRSTSVPRLDINSATAAELETVPGIDSALADAIVAYRQDYGGFVSLTELHTALGLDSLWLSEVRRYLVVG